MPTQRPFLSNFLAAFRAHSHPLPKAPSSMSSSAAVAPTAAIWTAAQSSKPSPQSPAAENATTSPRPIHPKAQQYNAQSSTVASDRQLHTSLSPLQHSVSPQTHLPRSPSSTGLPMYAPPNKPQPEYPTCQQTSFSGSRARRRGSDSSSDSGGFREVRGNADIWYVGGRTAGGDERYYKLSMVKRDRSLDRISADQLSL
ncbi:hypothetical protein M433DRAFT_62192 [Acidomyces richmondensis BFW]|nr:MAG: hypothetical protein FE78DRAFT_139587 [Acidomyces sp. 'richmondensis']KYG47896.1 hypothetical protein M433DRAFT_62192 [Acidomyces richmondensis BFW]